MENIREFGGNSFLLNLGNFLIKKGEKYVNEGRKIIISNPTCRLINPFTLIINFTINNTDKYQVILQGDYKDKYKEFGTDVDVINNDEMFEIIISKQKEWFLRK